MASGDVLAPPTTSTSGMMCGGLNGCPTRMRSGCLHFDCITLGVIPDELEAIRESSGVASSMSAKSFILKSGRSGPFSWMRSACDSAWFMFVVKVKRLRAAPSYVDGAHRHAAVHAHECRERRVDACNLHLT